MTTIPTLAVVSGDPGGASALAPVLIALRAQPHFKVHALAYRQARDLWAQRGLPFKELEEGLTRAQAQAILQHTRADVLLTSTSFNGVDLEKHFIAASRELGVPSLALLDFWANYAVRFADAGGHFAYLPDRIAIMDEQAKAEMLAIGFPAETLIITGQPAFDELPAYKQRRPLWRAAVREQLGIAPDEPMVLFASQPLAGIYGRDASSPDFLGYTEQSVLDDLVTALEHLARHREKPVCLVIRPHPREDVRDYEQWQDSSIRVLVTGAIGGRGMALAADLVTGMTTMLLVEASLMGCPVVSLQPGLRGADVLPTNRSRVTRAVYKSADIEPEVDRMLFSAGVQDAITNQADKTHRIIPDATNRVLQLIRDMLAPQQQKANRDQLCQKRLPLSKLAINGGKPVRAQPFPAYVTIGQEEKRAVADVMDSTVLSQFLGSWSPDFYGGPRVQQLEQEWAGQFGVRHAVSVNSATSGLNAAVGAAGVGPGDEVICSPYTMSASATCALVYGAVPVFADIDPDIFCITAESIRRVLTPRTKAVVVVDIFGHPADMHEIMKLAREHSLMVIEDAAQAPGARYHGRYAGTLAHMGVFSLNYHKTIHSGEGGVVVTDEEELAERLQLIRNHAEAVVNDKGTRNLVNMVGFNYRMTEIEAAIASEQLKKLERLLAPRIEAAEYLSDKLQDLPGLRTPVVRPEVRHGYYVYALRFDAARTGVRRDRFTEALQAEGLRIMSGYTRPLYLEPLYQKRVAIGDKGFPFTSGCYEGQVSYEKGICPTTEKMHFEELLYTDICHANITRRDLDDTVAGFHKVMEHLEELRA